MLKCYHILKECNSLSLDKYDCSTEECSASVAGDDQVRVFDIGDVASGPCSQLETVHNTRQACRRVLRCHEGRVKRIVTENSPDLFLTVAEVHY